MNLQLERKIRVRGEILLMAMLSKGDCEATRKLQAEHAELLAQRTPEDHAEMARKMGLPA